MKRAALVLLVLACAHPALAPPPGSRFVEVEGTHFALLTDLAEPAARESLTEMENILAALAAASWHGEALPREKLRVVEFAAAADLHRFASPAMSAFYQPVDLFGDPMMVISAEEGGADNVVLKHELAHALHGTFLPRSPRWFFEGIACYLETLRHDPARHRYVLGEPSDDRLHYLRYHQDTDFVRVLSLPTREAVLLGGQEGYAFQSASWLLVFYLANERSAELDDYVARLARREEAQAAFDAAFRGLTFAALAAEVERYFAESLRPEVQEAEAAVRYRLRYAPEPGAPVTLRVRPVPPADVLALRAELLFLSPGLPRSRAHLPQAREMAEEALRVDPSHPLALAVQLAMPESANAAPVERIRAAAAARPDDYRSQMLLAFAVGGSQPEARRAALARAVELAPENPTVLNALAWHDVSHGRAADAVPLAAKAAGLAPTRAAVLDTLATALAFSARCEEAVRVEERAVELTSEHASGPLRKRLLLRLDAMRAGCVDVPLDEQ